MTREFSLVGLFGFTVCIMSFLYICPENVKIGRKFRK